MEFKTYALVGGLLDGGSVEFPADFDAADLEFWVQPSGLKGKKFFVRYVLTRDRKKYRYSSRSMEGTGADYQEDVTNDHYMTIVDEKNKELACDVWRCVSEMGR